MHHRITIIGVGLTCALGVMATSALGQEATNTPAATQPAAGSLYLRQKARYIRLGDDPSPERGDRDVYESITSLTYGLRRDVSLSLEVPLEYSVADTASGTERDFGVNDIALTIKYRPLQIDLNPLDSVRFAVFGGVEVPSGDRGFSSESVDVFAGGIFMAILGRHGITQSVSYSFNQGAEDYRSRAGDGPDDALRYDTAYLYRLAPEAYGAETGAATYLTLELNGLYELNGDHEILLGGGVLYEARSFALEAAVGLPIHQDVDERAERDLIVTLGVRILF
ncbi:MAG: hypothetical protein KDA25_13450 [Phycisphaerales bacterium]|nr:hypothetical protein [Phycisphaerales bacterium]